MRIDKENRTSLVPGTKAYTQRKNEAAGERLSLLFVIATFASVAMLFVENRGGAKAMLALHTYICPILMLVSLIGIGVGIGISAYGKQRAVGTDYALKAITPASVIAFSASVLVISFMYYTVFQKEQNYKTVAAIIILTALAFIYESFSTDFFVFSSSSVLGAVLLVTQSNGFSFGNVRCVIYSVLQILSFVFALFLIVSVIFLTDRNGKLKLFGKKLPFIGRHAKKWPLASLGALLLAADILACVVNSGFRVYGIIAVGALYLAVCIFYAVKQLSR